WVCTTPITKTRWENSCTSSASAEASPCRIRSARVRASPAPLSDGRRTPSPSSGGLYIAGVESSATMDPKTGAASDFFDESCHVPVSSTTLPLNDTLDSNSGGDNEIQNID